MGARLVGHVGEVWSARRPATRRRVIAGAGTAGAPLALGMLAGCGRQGGEAQVRQSGPASIRVMHRGAPAQQEELDLAVKLFHQRFGERKWTAEVDFHPSSAGNYNDKLLSLQAAGTLPDSFYMNAEHLSIFASRGAFYDLNAIAAKDKATGDYWPELLEMSRYKGKLHGLPKDYSPHVIYVNEGALQAAGVPLPAPGWTWADLLEIARRFTQRGADGAFDRLGLFGPAWYILVWQNGGALFDKDVRRCTLNDTAAVEALQWQADLYTRHKVAGLSADLQAMGVQNVQQGFQNGRVALWWMGRWGVPDLRKMEGVTWDAYPLPKGKQEANVFLQSGPTVAATTKHPDVAWEFCKAWTGPEGQSINIETGVSVPPIREPSVQDRYLSKTPPSRRGNQVFLDAVKSGVPLPTTPNIGWGEWGPLWDPELSKVWTGEVSAKAATDTIVPKVNAFIAEREGR
ncbi:MAG TPA: sugar ABC transporter substrate-binding protein [Chloroflexota bacterium]|nr:sugar ABC transporter substrate-binding protein [Chloroflexota bacterium]